VSPVRPRVIEAMLSFAQLEAVRLEAYSSLETARCFAALQHLPKLAHLDLRLSGSVFALEDNLEALACLACCSRLVCCSHVDSDSIPAEIECLHACVGMLRRRGIAAACCCWHSNEKYIALNTGTPSHALLPGGRLSGGCQGLCWPGVLGGCPSGNLFMPS
jgi:hypothetical protein